MAAGHIVAGECLDVAVSKDYFFSMHVPTISTSSGVSYASAFKKVGSTWYSTIRELNLSTYDSVDYAYPVGVPTFASCDTESTFNDGLILGWAVVAAMAAAWAISFLRKAVS